MLKQYVEIFELLRTNSSRIKKEQILKDHKEVDGFQEILKFAFNPMISTGLAKRKIEKETTIKPEIEINTIFDAMRFVKDNNTGNDRVIATIQSFLNKLETQEEKDLAIGILIKDMPYGISRTTLNKVYGESFIEKYGVQLAGGYSPGKSDLSGGFAVSLKLDGNRITAFNHEDGVKFFTRSGKEVEGLIELEEDFRKLPYGFAYDGEVIAKNPDDLASKDLFNLTQTIVRRKGEKRGLDFVMFDHLPINELENGSSKLIYADRLREMKMLFEVLIEKDSNIKMVPIYYIGEDEAVIPEILAKVEKEGLEGLMINKLNGFYEKKRTKNLLKVKTFHNVDLRVIDVKEDIRGGKCGSLTVDYKGYRVDVAGLKEEEKIKFWNDPSLVVGKIIEVKYFEETSNAHGTVSLRFPSFIQIRHDKNEVSYA